MEVIQTNLKHLAAPRLRKCAQEFLSRRSRQLEDPIDTSIKFVASSKAQKGRVSDVTPGAWPNEFDDPMKECIVNVFAGIEFDTDAYEFSYELEYPIRLAPPPRDPTTWPEGSRLYQDGGSPRQPR